MTTNHILDSIQFRGNLLKTQDGKLAFLDFGMMADIDEDDRYGLFGLVIGLQNKDLPLVTENLLKVIYSRHRLLRHYCMPSPQHFDLIVSSLQLGFLKDSTQMDQLVPRLRSVLLNSTGGTGKASDVNFARLQAELDEISRENVLKFSTPPFFTVILRSLTILEGVALSVDPKFRIVRGSYPYVLSQLLSPEDNQRTPVALQKLLIRLLTVNGEGKYSRQASLHFCSLAHWHTYCRLTHVFISFFFLLLAEREINWERLRDLLQLAQKARSKYNPADEEKDDDKATLSRQTIELLFKFLTSKTGLFLKRPLVHELAEAIDGMASIGEARLLMAGNGLLPALPGMNGPVNERVMSEMRMMIDTFQDALKMQNDDETFVGQSQARLEAMRQLLAEISVLLTDERLREDAGPLLDEVRSVIQMVAVEVLEIRGSRAMRSIMRLVPSP